MAIPTSIPLPRRTRPLLSPRPLPQVFTPGSCKYDVGGLAAALSNGDISVGDYEKAEFFEPHLSQVDDFDSWPYPNDGGCLLGKEKMAVVISDRPAGFSFNEINDLTFKVSKISFSAVGILQFDSAAAELFGVSLPRFEIISKTAETFPTMLRSYQRLGGQVHAVTGDTARVIQDGETIASIAADNKRTEREVKEATADYLNIDESQVLDEPGQELVIPDSGGSLTFTLDTTDVILGLDDLYYPKLSICVRQGIFSISSVTSVGSVQVGTAVVLSRTLPLYLPLSSIISPFYLGADLSVAAEVSERFLIGDPGDRPTPFRHPVV